MIIREGRSIDLERCLDMAENFYEVAGYKDDIPMCGESCISFMEAAMDQGMLHVAEVDHEYLNGYVVGFVLGICSPSVMNKNYLAGAELAWWVEPEYRKGEMGIKLLKAIEKSAKDLGVKMWSMMSLEAVEPERMAKLYKSLGYKATERTYVRVL